VRGVQRQPLKDANQLRIEGLLELFSRKLFSVTETERAKPYPGVFLYPAEKMARSASRIAVVEDNMLGLRAGIATGMTVFG
jgi:HAD superfamily hydrolase (TIGR01509 family)